MQQWQLQTAMMTTHIAHNNFERKILIYFVDLLILMYPAAISISFTHQSVRMLMLMCTFSTDFMVLFFPRFPVLAYSLNTLSA